MIRIWTRELSLYEEKVELDDFSLIVSDLGSTTVLDGSIQSWEKDRFVSLKANG